jgi:hypothetical protein
MQKTIVVILHTEGYGVECYAKKEQVLTNAEKWLLDLKSQEANVMLNQVVQHECIEELQYSFENIPASKEKEALGEISESSFGNWVEVKDITEFSEQNHCLIFTRFLYTC